MATVKVVRSVGVILDCEMGGKTARCRGLIHQKKLKTQSTPGKTVEKHR